MTPKVTKKYTLLSAGDDPSQKICAFFQRGECRNGDSCKFSHGQAVSPSAAASSKGSTKEKKNGLRQHAEELMATMDSSSSLSSSSDDDDSDDEAAPAPAPTPAPAQPKKKKEKKVRSGILCVCVCVCVCCVFPKTNLFFCSSVTCLQPASPPVVKTATKTPTKRKRDEKQTPTLKAGTSNSSTVSATNAMSNLLSGFPISAFSTLEAPNDGNNDPPPHSPAPPKKSKVAPTKTEKTADKTKQKYLTESGRKWGSIMTKTKAHNNYENSYNFTSSKFSDRDHAWFTAPAYDKNNEAHKQLPEVIAIDCEMVECTDPLTGEIEGKALARLSVISGIDPDVTIIDTLVKPYLPITNYRTRVNGITEESLENCTFTLRHAQAVMNKLCTSETVIVGHALHNDLVSLKMDHKNVVDTAFLYTAEDDETKLCSLRDVTTSVLKEDMPTTHDSVLDAKNSFLAAAHYLEKKGKVDLVVRTKRPGAGSGSNTNNGDTLFAHRIPKTLQPDQILKMIERHTKIVPEKVEEYVKPTDDGFCKCIVRFPSETHCELAFKALKGEAKVDKSDRLQKRVYTKDGEYIFVRKNTVEKQ